MLWRPASLEVMINVTRRGLLNDVRIFSLLPCVHAKTEQHRLINWGVSTAGAEHLKHRLLEVFWTSPCHMAPKNSPVGLEVYSVLMGYNHPPTPSSVLMKILFLWEPNEQTPPTHSSDCGLEWTGVPGYINDRSATLGRASRPCRRASMQSMSRAAGTPKWSAFIIKAIRCTCF